MLTTAIIGMLTTLYFLTAERGLRNLQAIPIKPSNLSSQAGSRFHQHGHL